MDYYYFIIIIIIIIILFFLPKYTVGYRVYFLEVKRPARGVDYPPLPSSAEVKERRVTPLILHWAVIASYRVNFNFSQTHQAVKR